MASHSAPMKEIILGGVAWDTVVYVDEFPGPRPHSVFARGSNEVAASSGAGKALNLSHLGVDVTLWALVGDDDAGRRIRRERRRRSVEFVDANDPAGTVRHINLMDREGERISIFAHAGSDWFDVDVASTAAAAAAADLVSVTIANHCRRFLPMLREMRTPAPGSRSVPTAQPARVGFRARTAGLIHPLCRSPMS